MRLADQSETLAEGAGAVLNDSEPLPTDTQQQETWMVSPLKRHYRLLINTH